MLKGSINNTIGRDKSFQGSTGPRGFGLLKFSFAVVHYSNLVVSALTITGKKQCCFACTCLLSYVYNRYIRIDAYRRTQGEGETERESESGRERATERCAFIYFLIYTHM